VLGRTHPTWVAISHNCGLALSKLGKERREEAVALMRDALEVAFRHCLHIHILVALCHGVCCSHYFTRQSTCRAFCHGRVRLPCLRWLQILVLVAMLASAAMAYFAIATQHSYVCILAM
jgi:hypothetical protein